MMGSVNERTTEIGVFRAIGFRKSHIMRIILLEAALVSLLAGALGYVAGMAGAFGALPFMSDTSSARIIWETWIAIGSVALSVVLGISASIYPALHASRMDPAEALRSL
jgi:putative ABC transport system permease protein